MDKTVLITIGATLAIAGWVLALSLLAVENPIGTALSLVIAILMLGSGIAVLIAADKPK